MALNNASIQFITSGAPGGDAYCFTTVQRLFLDMAASLSGFLPGTYSTFVVSATEPDVSDRNKVWIQIDADGLPTGRWFIYLGGWYMRNPRRNDATGVWTNERVWWVGSESDAWKFDGGSGDDPASTPPTTKTGAMWQRDRDFDFRFPLAAGTSPKPTTVSIGDVGGEEEHVMTMGELPKGPFKNVAPGQSNGVNTIWGSSSDGTKNGSVYGNDHGLAQSSTQEIPIETVVSPGNDDPITNLPPYRVGIWLKPTARIYFSP